MADAYDMRSMSEDLGWLIFISFVASIAVTVMSVSASLDAVDDESITWNASFYYYMPDDTYAEYEAVDHQPNFHELNKALRHYREMATNIVKQLSLAHEVASRTEQLLFPNHATETKRCNASEHSAPSFLSSKLEDKISKSAELLEQNIMVLESLLKEFPINIGPSPLHNAYSDDNLGTGNAFPPSLNNQQQTQSSDGIPTQSSIAIARYISPYSSKSSLESEPYDTASHIITHLARDWTATGVSIRKETHDWIVNELLQYHHQVAGSAECSNQSLLSPVLVPGAGMGRLAFEIALAQDTNTQNYPFAVEAVDNSLVMASSAYHMLQQFTSNVENRQTIYPLASDPFVNEEDNQRRWEAATFPEGRVSNQLLNIQQSSHEQPSLSYVVGDFVNIYSSPSKHGIFGAIATCFFIDTATNIYEYILTIRNLLRTGGVWLNLGPIQWHNNAQLQPSANELKDIIMLSGFKIIHWEISEELVAYRHPDDIKVGTRVEAYRPLKFVAVLQPNDHYPSNEARANISLTSSLEKLRQSTGRKAMAEQNVIINDDNDDNIQL